MVTTHSMHSRVWNRTDPLTPSEYSTLKTSGIKRLYWQLGELESHGTTLVLRRTAEHGLDATFTARPDSNLEIIPVVRIATAIRSPEQFSGEALGMALRPVADASPDREMQVDFDCPSRLLPVYAERLRVAKRVADIRRLTITALADWVNAPEAPRLWPEVDAVYPMLYDMQTDPVPAAGDSSPCRPGGCSTRRTRRATAGLAALPSRLVRRAAGLCARNALRSCRIFAWAPAELGLGRSLVQPRLDPRPSTRRRHDDPACYAATRVGQDVVAMGSYLAVRTAALSAIRAGIAQADATGARGWSCSGYPTRRRHCGPRARGWSLPQLLALLPSETKTTDHALRLKLRHAEDGSDRWILR